LIFKLRAPIHLQELSNCEKLQDLVDKDQGGRDTMRGGIVGGRDAE